MITNSLYYYTYYYTGIFILVHYTNIIILILSYLVGIREDRSRGGRSTYEGASAFIHRRFKRLSESSDYPTPGGAGGGVGGAAHQKKMKYSSSVIEGQSPEQPLHIYPEVPTLLQVIIMKFIIHDAEGYCMMLYTCVYIKYFRLLSDIIFRYHSIIQYMFIFIFIYQDLIYITLYSEIL